MTSHLVLRGGTVFDGVAPDGSPRDVRIRAGVVAEVGPQLPTSGAVEVDVAGSWVVPGFIDAHSHCDLGVLSGHEMELRALAGVTTEIVGQDGLGPFPVTPESLELMAESLLPITGESVGAGWDRISGYLDEVDAGAFARAAVLVPHGAVRARVIGAADRAATGREVSAMQSLVAQGMTDGAVGMSSGLSYSPAQFATTEELIQLCKAMPAERGRYVTHLRSYGDAFDQALDEALSIAANSRRPLHLSHFHVSGPGRAGTAPRYLDVLNQAKGRGVQMSWDSYPYRSACTFLSSVLPAEVQSLTTAERLHLLTHMPESVAQRLDVTGPGPTVAAGWEDIRLAGLAGTELRAWDGRTVAAVSRDAGISSGAVVSRILAEYAQTACMVVNQGHDENIKAIAADVRQVVGSDGIPGAGVPHPRAGHSFLRFLRWSRDGEIGVSVGDMVRKMTAQTAELFQLSTGRLSPGSPADLLVLDPELLDDGPDLGRSTPTAVRQSYIGGEAVVVDGQWLGRKLNRTALRGGTS